MMFLNLHFLHADNIVDCFGDFEVLGGDMSLLGRWGEGVGGRKREELLDFCNRGEGFDALKDIV